ncbi:hypothetical protein I306_00183 [Cryptococcus gattii EJB2]|uniref:Uncharacterized protein n=1 Tax=Cryptococcus gattii EJB2 TaxID=1296103 RepID=A0ABR5C473_9TREE|nr:hypothetical protein I306_00183 [Cryptococcus gattii EJB2]
MSDWVTDDVLTDYSLVPDGFSSSDFG